MNEVIIEEAVSYYFLDKEIVGRFDMNKTKENVIKFINDYKVIKARNIKSLILRDSGLTYKLDPNKVSNSGNRNHSFSDNSDTYLDTTDKLLEIEPIIETLRKSFSPEEKKYYDCCLANKYSEEYVCNIIKNGISRTGLIPIKNSCILKIALAFDIAIEKRCKGGDVY